MDPLHPLIVSETIIQVFQGHTCWVIYKDNAFNSPIKCNLYAVVSCEYDNETEESFVAPLIPSIDGIMTWANYFNSFVGAIHQEDRPSDAQIELFTKKIEETEKEIMRIIKGEKAQDPNSEDTKEPASTIKFQSKRKPTKPDDNT